MKHLLENWREYLNEKVQQTDFSNLGTEIKAYHKSHPEPENDMSGFEILQKYFRPFKEKERELRATYKNSIRVGYKNALKSGDDAQLKAANADVAAASGAWGNHIAQGLPKITQAAFSDAKQSNIQFGKKALEILLGMIDQKEEDLKQLVQHKTDKQ